MTNLCLSQDVTFGFWSADKTRQRLEYLRNRSLPYRVDFLDWTEHSFLLWTKFTITVGGTSVAAVKEYLDILCFTL